VSKVLDRSTDYRLFWRRAFCQPIVGLFF